MRSAHAWAYIVSAIRHAAPAIRGRYLEVRFEDLISDTETTLRSVCEFIGEEFDAAMLDYHRNEPHLEMPANSRVMEFHRTSIQAPDRSKIFEWRTSMSPSDRVIFEGIAGKLLWNLEYPRASSGRLDRLLARLKVARLALSGRAVFTSPALE